MALHVTTDITPAVEALFPFASFRPHQKETITAIVQAWLDGEKTVILEAPTGCHRAGQRVIMADGSLRAVETLEVGEALMGPDSKPRIILQLCRGVGPMVEIRPTTGKPWVVNTDHVLTLVGTTSHHNRFPGERGGEVIDLSVTEYQQRSQWFKHLHKLFHVDGVDFPLLVEPLPVDPYCLGALLGDGTLALPNRVEVTKPDPEIHEAFALLAQQWGLHHRFVQGKSHASKVVKDRGGRTRNPLLDTLRALGLMGISSDQRFVPRSYLVTTREERLQILAGLLDTDGSYNNGCYDWLSKSWQLAQDTAFIARSVGLCVTERVKYVEEKPFYRLMISGHVDRIPCRIPRKQAAPRQQKKDALRTGFTIHALDTREPYYGFTLTEDGRYLLDDFTVTHNSGKSVIAYTAAQVYKALSAGVMPDTSPYGAILVHTRALQSQYESQLQQTPVLWSNVHYPCPMFPTEDVHWSSWCCQKMYCKMFHSCDYAVARARFSRANVGCTNFAFFLTNHDLAPSVLVIDEAHRFESVLCDYFSLAFLLDKWQTALAFAVEQKALSAREMARVYGFIKDVIASTDLYLPEAIRVQSEVIYSILSRGYAVLAEYVRDLRLSQDPRTLRHQERERLEKLNDLLLFLEANTTYTERLMDAEVQWIRVEPTAPASPSGVAPREKPGPAAYYKPLYVQTYAEQVFSRSERILLMSATICGAKHLASVLGIPRHTFLTVPSTFPVKNRPVILLDEGGDFTQANRHNALERLAGQVERLLTDQFKSVRGIIHTVSYNNAYTLLRHLKKTPVASRLILPKSEDLLEIRALLEQQDATVLVAPTLTEGIDLPDDLCRFILFLKCPWAHLGDAWVKARMEHDYRWYLREAVIATVQGSGRATRHDQDWSVTLLLDGQFSRLLTRGKAFLPNWFLDSLSQ